MGRQVERETDVKRFALILEEKGVSYLHLFRLAIKEGE
jgi:hypothetical protein